MYRTTLRPRTFALAAIPLVALAFVGSTRSAHGAPAAVAQGITWGPAPAVFPAGAEMAVLQGDPSKSAPFTVRLRFPNGYKIAPHWHPTDEYLTVIQGTFKVGMGTKFDEATMLVLPTGGFATAPAKEPHYSAAQGATIVQINSMGPFALTYVNPADAPKAGR